MYWAQYESRCSHTASLTGIPDAEEYKVLLGIDLDCATLRKVESDQADTIIKAADSGKFKEEHTWPEREVKFENDLSTIAEVNDMPLSYVLRAQSAPDRTTDFQGDFIEETIASVPLSGAHLQEDTRKIHHLLKNYFVAETTEQWISSIEKRANGRDNFDALHRHYSSEGNVR